MLHLDVDVLQLGESKETTQSLKFCSENRFSHQLRFNGTEIIVTADHFSVWDSSVGVQALNEWGEVREEAGPSPEGEQSPVLLLHVGWGVDGGLQLRGGLVHVLLETDQLGLVLVDLPGLPVAVLEPSSARELGRNCLSSPGVSDYLAIFTKFDILVWKIRSGERVSHDVVVIS